MSTWASVDPLTEKYPGWSAYNYTLNNPVVLTDPDGRSATGCCGGTAGGAALAKAEATYNALVRKVENSSFVQGVKALNNAVAEGIQKAGEAIGAFDKKLKNPVPAGDYKRVGQLPFGFAYTKDGGTTEGGPPSGAKQYETVNITVITTFKGSPSTTAMTKPDVPVPYALDKASEVVNAAVNTAPDTYGLVQDQTGGSTPSPAPSQNQPPAAAPDTTYFSYPVQGGNVEVMKVKGEPVKYDTTRTSNGTN
jgi:hypothetical protein